MQSDQQDIAQGLRMAAVAVVSAVITATAVIGAGQAWLSHSAAAQADAPSGGQLIQTAG